MAAATHIQRVLFRLAAALVRPSASSAPAARILVIKPDHLGDLLLATPALRALRTARPDAHITGLVGPWAQRMWQGLSSLDDLRTLEFPGFARTGGRRSRLRILQQTIRAATELRHGRYDAALLFRDDDYWSALVCTLAGIPQRIGTAHPKLRELLTQAVPCIAEQHVTAQALAVVAQLTGVDTQSPPLELQTDPDECAWAAAVLPECGRAVICHPGTGGAAKQWPAGHWAQLISALQQQGQPVLLSGSPAESEQLSRIAAACADPPPTIDRDLTIGRLAALFARARLVIGVDSGPLHIAVSQHTASIHLFGPSDARRFGPWGDSARHRVLRSGLFCSPCGSLTSCPRATAPSECMAGIAPSQVLLTAISLLTDVT